VHLCLNQPKLAAELATLVLTADDWVQDALVIAAAVEAFVAAGQSDQAQHLLARAVTNGLDPSSPYLLASAGRIDLTNGDLDSAIPRLSAAARVFQQREYRIDETCARLLAVTALAARGKQVAAQAELDRALGLADQCGAAALRRSGRSLKAGPVAALPAQAEPGHGPGRRRGRSSPLAAPATRADLPRSLRPHGGEGRPDQPGHALGPRRRPGAGPGLARVRAPHQGLGQHIGLGHQRPAVC
jgi:tetratricopeptide (TPR) repeat protein